MLLHHRTSGLTSVLLVLSLCPIIVLSQTYIKYAVCTFCSGFFIAYGCPENYDSLFCRLQAFKLNVLNCRTYPCVDYDAPVQNTCVDFPLGCPIQHIKAFGLCSPLKMCCGTGGEEASTGLRRSWLRLGKQGRWKRGLKHSFRLNKVKQTVASAAADGSKSAKNIIHASYLNGSKDGIFSFTDFPTAQQDAIRASYTTEFVPADLPQNLNDPDVAEKTVVEQYEKLKQEIFYINEDELTSGRPAILLPSFEHFRAVVLGQKPIK